MANPTIRVKRSSVEGKVPAVDQIKRGEFAINSFDGKVFILKDQSSVGVATTTVTVNPWTEDSVGAGISYAGQVSATSFVGDGSGLTNVGGSSGPNEEEYFTATQGQTEFSASQEIPTTYIQVYVNGVKLRTSDFGISGSSVTLTNGCNVGDEVDIIIFGSDSNEEEYFTAIQGQTTFSVSQMLPTYIQVFVNGIKLRTTDYGTSGTTVTLNSGCNLGDEVDIVMFSV